MPGTNRVLDLPLVPGSFNPDERRITSALASKTKAIILFIIWEYPVRWMQSSKAGKKYGRVPGNMKVTEDISQELIRLRLFYDMQEQEVDRVVQAIRKFFN